MGPDLEFQTWIAPYSLNCFWDYFWGIVIFCHLFWIWFTKITIIIIITKQKHLSWLLSDKVSFLLPSPLSPWMEITACQCLQHLAQRQIFQQKHLARWQAPEAVVLAACTEPGQCWGWGHAAGTVSPWAAASGEAVTQRGLHQCSPRASPAAPRAANSSKPQLPAPAIRVCLSGSLSMSVSVFKWLSVNVCMCFLLEAQDGLELHLHQCKVTCKTLDAIQMTRYL